MAANAWKFALFCILGGLCFTASALNAGYFGWWWIAGVLITAALLPVVRCGPPNLWAQFGAITAILVVVGLVCTVSEAVLFFPETRKSMIAALIGGSVLYALAAAVLVLLARVLKLRSTSEVIVGRRPARLLPLMVLLSGLSYVVYYFVFGAITFQFFTKKYYPHAAEQALALGNWFWAYQWGRGLLMTLAVLPVIYMLRMPRWRAALVVGLMIWIVGGAAPLLVPNTMMVPAQRYIHIIEIMTQNVPLGITAVWLLRPKRVKTPRTNEHPVPV